MSGTNPKCSEAQNFPVRPIPDWTSSAIVRIRCRSAMSVSTSKNSRGGTTYPPSPWIGSTTMAATDSGSTTVLKRVFSMNVAQAISQEG